VRLEVTSDGVAAAEVDDLKSLSVVSELPMEEVLNRLTQSDWGTPSAEGGAFWILIAPLRLAGRPDSEVWTRSFAEMIDYAQT
jgi:hypothetical protein